MPKENAIIIKRDNETDQQSEIISEPTVRYHTNLNSYIMIELHNIKETDMNEFGTPTKFAILTKT